MHTSKGFTLLEIMVVLAIIVLLSITFVPPILEQQQTAKINASVMQAKKILQVVELARNKIASSSTAANLTVTHTYAAPTGWVPVSTVTAMLSSPPNIPANNLFDLPYLVRFDNQWSYIAIDLPFLESNYGFYPTSVVNGKTRIVITTQDSKIGNASWVARQKAILHGEARR